MALEGIQYKSKGDARQKIKIELLRPRETDVGVVQSYSNRHHGIFWTFLYAQPYAIHGS